MRSSDILLGFVGVCALGYFAWRENETREICKKVGMVAEKVQNSPEWKIREGFVEEAAKRSADEQIKSTFANIQSSVEREFSSIIRQRVRETVNSYSNSIADRIGDEIATQSLSVDKDLVFKKAVEKAQGKAMQKFDQKLDDFLEGLSDKLEDDSYSSRRRRVVVL